MQKPSVFIAIMLFGALLVATAWVGTTWFFLPVGQAKTEVTARIEIDGKQFQGQAIWLTTASTRNAWPLGGISYGMQVAGDAVAIALSDGTFVFLHPYNGLARICAGQEYVGREGLAVAISQFKGPCTIDRGDFTHVAFVDSTPQFFSFSIDTAGNLKGIDGGPAPSEALALQRSGFSLSSIVVESTEKPLGTQMTATFPWILALPRTDYDAKGEYREGYYGGRSGVTYAQFFTSYLPTPSGDYKHSVAF